MLRRSIYRRDNVGKVIIGSLLFVAGIFMCITLVGAVVGVPMVFVGFGLLWVGAGQLGWRAVKGGVAVGKAINKARQGE